SPPVEARPVLRLPVRRRPAHAQCTADGREWVSRHGLNTPYQLGLFFTSACAAWRISTSMVFRPSARSSSRIRASASRSSRAGTTSSPAATAVFAPCSKSRFHLRTTEELTSNSRASPESVISPRRTRSICSFLKAVVNSRRPSAPLRNSPILLLLEEVQHNLSQVSTPIGGRRNRARRGGGADGPRGRVQWARAHKTRLRLRLHGEGALRGRAHLHTATVAERECGRGGVSPARRRGVLRV